MRSTASTIASTAARRTSWRYRLLLPAGRVGNVRLAQTAPASKWPSASSTVTPHSPAPSSIAQSSEEGPRSPGGPGCTTRQRCADQTDSGMSFLSIGHTMRSGRCVATAASIAAPESTTSTSTSCPSSVSAIQARWLRLLWAETRKRMRIPRRRLRERPFRSCETAHTARQAGALLVELVHGAGLRGLVLAPALHLRAVADAPVGDVVEGDLDHELGPQGDPFELASLGPAAGLAAAALAGLVRRQEVDELALLLGREAAGVPDLAQAPVRS